MKGTIFRKKYSSEAYLKKVINTKEDNLMFKGKKTRARETGDLGVKGDKCSSFLSNLL